MHDFNIYNHENICVFAWGQSLINVDKSLTGDPI